PFRPRMAELDRDLCVSLDMDEFNDALPGGALFGCIEAGAAGRNAAFRGNTRHFRKDEPGATFGTLGVVNEMPFVRRAVLGAILRHWRNAHPICELDSAHAKRHEHRWSRRIRDVTCRLLFEPFLRAGKPLWIALAQVFMAY